MGSAHSYFESFYHLIALYYFSVDQLDNAQAIIDLLDSFDANPKLVGKLETLVSIKMAHKRLMKDLKKNK